ncbi:hypothetical protein JVX90_14410 [Gordonia sp. PDNC005]|uniref:hypothetical protein n=1 Tax=unclassified Gordonia (in: high G+C Gram-positive bacteria) TaxID=2657482 RepID=UPI0019629251|nr:hypothetical protein [Gordonia sp. PDNC005]QRY61599.1 hypothetical protein JVX90_14410 [Gordonia sp. PDNC005]
MTQNALDALETLRSAANFQWSIVPIMVIVIWLYANEVEKRNWGVVFGGLALLAADTFNELWNSAFFHITDRAPVWGAPGHSSFQILIGWNIEIVLMFATLGLAAAKMLPKDQSMRIAGVPNRWVLIAVNAALAVGIEVVLNRMGVLTWDWSWWSPQFPFIVWLVGYVPFFAACFWVHDMSNNRKRAIAVGSMLGANAAFATVLGAVGWL